MTTLKTLEDVASIVLVGNFNPAIFQPAWLAAKGLVRESEAREAVVEVIHPEVTQYRLDWVTISVQRERFAAATSDPARRVALRDLVIGIFGLLEETPTAKMGLNRTMHVDMTDDKTFHALGHLLAPKDPWEGILEKPGMRAVLIVAARSDGAPGQVQYRVEPSQKHKHAAFFDVNSEYRSPPETEAPPTAYFMTRVRHDWERVLAEAEVGIAKLVERAQGSK